MRSFKRLKRTDIYKGVRVHLVKERMLTPEGKEVDWELIVHPGAAAVIPVDGDGKILMVRQYRLPSDSMVLEIPAGILDSPDEDPKDCAARELEEETGYTSDSIEYLFNFYSSIGITDEVIHIYVAKNLVQTKQNLDEHEFVELERYTLEELMRMIYEGSLVDCKSIAALLMYKDSLSRQQ